MKFLEVQFPLKMVSASYILLFPFMISVYFLGCSIGSLARSENEPGVQNIIVKNTTFQGTQNGLRIKSWARPSNGFVQGVRFINARMINAHNPIIIDQNYCPYDSQTCPNQVIHLMYAIFSS